MFQTEIYNKLKSELKNARSQLLVVTKTRTIEEIQQAYAAGQRYFGESYVQELIKKQPELPNDIKWHMIGHLQTNKVKYLAPFISMIQSVDSIKLLKEINKKAAENKRIIDCLIQIHIAQEDSKSGLKIDEVDDFFKSFKKLDLKFVSIRGLMGIASLTEDKMQIKNEFRKLKTIFDEVKQIYFPNDSNFDQISMGMSNDYEIAMTLQSKIVRIGSLLFTSTK